MTTQPIGTGFFFIDDNGDATENTLTRTGFGSSKTGFYISKTNVVFTGIESSTYRLRYVPNPPTLDALDDYFTLDASASGDVIIEDQYLNYVVKALDVMYSQWDEEIGAESFADQRFINVLNEILDNIRKEPNAYSIPDFSITF